MNESGTKFCEICQIKVEKNGIFHLFNNDCKSKLLELFPEIGLQLAQNSVICNQCFTQITNTQEFKQLQVKDEDNINKLLQQDISSNNNSKESDANFKDVLVNDDTICVKEEPGLEKIKEEFNVVGFIKDEVCDSQVIKDEFLLNIDNKQYYCHDCGCCTDTKQKLIKHIYKEHEKKDLIRKHARETIYQCDKCNYKSNFSSSWRCHKLTHTKKLFNCTQCNYTCLRPRGLKTHMYHHTAKYPFQCDNCDYKCVHKISLKRHTLSQHVGEKPYQCDNCDYKCVDKGSLKRHRLSHHSDERPYQCDKCGYKCVQKCSLKYHTLSQHAGEKPYQCDKCDYKCIYKYSLKNHILSQHAGEKPYQCDKCEYKCVYKYSLKNHTIFQHTGEKPYQCDKCGYKCVLKSRLKNHTLSQHSGEKPYQCDKCNYKCVSKNNLKRHTLSQHDGKKPYQCDKCDYKCVQKSKLENHTLFQHTIESRISVISAIIKVPIETVLTYIIYLTLECDKCDYKYCWESTYYLKTPMKSYTCVISRVSVTSAITNMAGKAV